MILRYLLALLGVLVGLAGLLRATVFATLVMSGDGMVPAIRPGEYILATYGDVSEPPRGAVVVFRRPGGDARPGLARVAAVAGDRLDAGGGRLLVNGQPAEPPLSAGEYATPAIVPPGHVFLRNERDENREDSRTWGPVATSALDSRARLIWLSLDWFTPAGQVRELPLIRWDRVLRVVR